MFQLYGILQKGPTLVGVAHMKDGRALLVGVTLAKGLNESKRKDLEREIKIDLAHPDQSISKFHGSQLVSQFCASALPIISAHLKDVDCIYNTVEAALETEGCNKSLFVCDNEEIFLHVCTDLGISNQDFLNFAELKAMLHQPQVRKTRSPVGDAHNFIGQLRTGKLPIYSIRESIASPEANQLLRLIHTAAPDFEQIALRANKFYLGNTDKYMPKEEIIDPKDLEFYPGDFRLPFDVCYFEYDETVEVTDLSGVRVTGTTLAKTVLIAQKFDSTFFGCTAGNAQNANYKHPSPQFFPQEDGTHYIGSLRFTKTQFSKGQYVFSGYGPMWKVNPQGRIIDVQTFLFDPRFLDHMLQEHAHAGVRGTIYRITPFLSMLNQPRTKITYSSVETQRKPGLIPFFDYGTIGIAPSKNGNEPPGGNAIEGRKRVALHVVRGHKKSTAPNGWVDWYFRGDAREGVVRESYFDMSKRAPRSSEPDLH